MATLYPPAQSPGPNILEQLKNQIEYYFSNDNLGRDFYLRRQMSSDGYVPLTTLGGFARVRQIAPTNDSGVGILALLIQALAGSSTLQLDSSGTKVRRRTGWENFILPAGEGEGTSPS